MACFTDEVTVFDRKVRYTSLFNIVHGCYYSNRRSSSLQLKIATESLYIVLHRFVLYNSQDLPDNEWIKVSGKF